MEQILPNELWETVADHLTPEDFLHLVLVSRTFYNKFIHILYKEIAITRFSEEVESSAVRHAFPERIAAIKALLLSKPTLASYVRLFRVSKQEKLPRSPEGIGEDQVNALEDVLGLFPAPLVISFHHLTLRCGNLRRICSAPPGGIRKLILSDCYTIPETVWPSFPLPNVEDCVISDPRCIDLLSDWTCWQYIANLKLSFMMGSDAIPIFEAHKEHPPSSCFSRLQRLELHYLTQRFAKLFSCMPALKHLQCDYYSDAVRVAEGAIMQLEVCEAPAVTAVSIIRGHPVKTLLLHNHHLQGSGSGIDMGTILPNFGSAVPLRDLTITDTKEEFPEYLGEILEKCPALESLKLTAYPGWDMPVVSRFLPPTKSVFSSSPFDRQNSYPNASHPSSWYQN
jgi:hypothetical protein